VKHYFQAGREAINNVALQYVHDEKKAFALSSSGARIFSLEATKMEIEDDSDKEEATQTKGLFVNNQENTITSNNVKLWEAVYPENIPEPILLNLQPPQETQVTQVVQETATVTTTQEEGATVVESVQVVESTTVTVVEENNTAIPSAIEPEQN